MKKTCFLAMLAAALMGGQVFADVTGTGIEGAEPPSESKYYGKHTVDSSTATGGNVTVKKDDSGEVPASAVVYGGCADKADVSNNTVTMQGGTVQSIYGGNGYTGASNNTVIMKDGTVSNIRSGNGGTNGNAYNNTVIMTGGNVNMLYGGSSGNKYSASDNVVIVTGGSITSALIAGYTLASDAKNNKVHLVGKGASNVKIADAQEAISTYGYTGVDAGISFSLVCAGYAPKGISTGNSIDIYGTGIEISGMFAYMQVLTFNITNDAVTAQTPEVAVTLTSTSSGNALDLTGVDLQVKDLNVEEWSAGMTVTLVQSKQEIKGASEELKVGKVVDITDATGAKVAQGKLQLVDGVEGTHLLNLTVLGNVPEPTTSTLGLLALAGLCMRKRRR